MDVTALGVWLKSDTIGQSHGTSSRVKDEISIEVQGNRLNLNLVTQEYYHWLHIQEKKNVLKMASAQPCSLQHNSWSLREGRTPWWVNRVCCIHTKEYYSASKRENSNICCNILQTRRHHSKWNKSDMVQLYVYWILWAGKIIEIKGKWHLFGTKTREHRQLFEGYKVFAR